MSDEGRIAELRARVAQARLVAIVRGGDEASVEASTRALADAGVEVLEVALTSPGALDVIRRVAADLGDGNEGPLLGAGTVLRPVDADAAIAAGAQFAVTPDFGAGARRAIELGLPVLAGAFTPTEITAALEAGATAVKLFPARSLGPDYLGDLRGPLPAVPLIPVGGVGLADVRPWLDAGALAVGIGSTLVGDAADGGSLDALAERATAFLSAVAR